MHQEKLIFSDNNDNTAYIKNSPANWHSFLAYKTASGFHFFASIADAKHNKKT